MTDTVLLEPIETDPEHFDHPDDLTPEEVEQGLALWRAIDDLDDHSNGIDPPGLRTASPGYAEALRRALIVKACLLEAGAPEVSIELQDGRPDSGDTWNLLRPYSVFSHHIASTPSVTNPTPGLSLVKRGRSDLPGPLANGTAGVDLVYRILTLGMANHPGYGGPTTFSGPLGSYTIPKDNARAYAWGTEYEGGYTNEVWDREYTNARTGKTMTFREFMGRCNAGLVRAIWLINGKGKNPGGVGEMDLSGYHGEHKTWAPDRKPDRKDYSTESGRAEIRKYNEPEDDMPSPKDLWEHPLPNLSTEKEGDTIPAGLAVAQAHKRATDARSNSAAALRQAQRNRDAIRKIAETLPDKTAREVMERLAEDDEETVEPIVEDAPA